MMNDEKGAKSVRSDRQISSPERLRLGAIGAGNMARALIGGIVEAGLVLAENCLASDVNPEAREAFAAATGARATDSNCEVLRACDTILLAVKPQNMKAALADLSEAVETRHLFVSIAAGIPTAAIEQGLGGSARVVRVMPNTPALVGAGMAGVARGSRAGDEDAALALRLMKAVGLAVEVDESLMDAVTAISGSGPAYFFQFVEHLMAAGVEQGLTPEVAATLAKQTALGAARMMAERCETPEQLRVAVTSPGGTTAAALAAFEDGGFGPMTRKAVQAAVDRGRELRG